MLNGNEIYCKIIQDYIVHIYGHVHTTQTGLCRQFDIGTMKKEKYMSMGGAVLWMSLEAYLNQAIHLTYIYQ